MRGGPGMRKRGIPGMRGGPGGSPGPSELLQFLAVVAVPFAVGLIQEPAKTGSISWEFLPGMPRTFPGHCQGWGPALECSFLQCPERSQSSPGLASSRVSSGIFLPAIPKAFSELSRAGIQHCIFPCCNSQSIPSSPAPSCAFLQPVQLPQGSGNTIPQR